MSAVRAQRAVEAPVVLCARRNVRACNVMLTLCLTGAVAEIACIVSCGTSSLSSSSSSPALSYLGFLLLVLFLLVIVLGEDDDGGGECLRLAGCCEDEDDGGRRACRAR